LKHQREYDLQFVPLRPGSDPASKYRGGRFQWYLAVKSHYGFAIVKEMKYT